MWLLWLLPVVAVVVGGYLVARTLSRRGPEIVLTFQSADGVAVGTKVLHKAVELGSVTGLRIAADRRDIVADIRMTRESVPYLTDKARFWVVRPRITGGNVSGLTTLLSGSYIEMDPGAKGGPRQTEFTGLEDPPGLRSDQPGTVFTLHAPTLASLSTGAPVFFRNVAVGEVLGTQISEGTAAITGQVFVRTPYDRRVRTGTVWWQAAGIATAWEPGGLRIQLSSVQAALAGGVSFHVPPGSPDYPVAASGTDYPLFVDEDAADRASNSQRLNYILYLQAPVPGLVAGSAVQIFGRQVGEVRQVRLTPGAAPGTGRVRVTLDVLPGALTMIGDPTAPEVANLAPHLVAGGLQGALATNSYITGAQIIRLSFAAQKPATPPELEDGTPILPNAEAGGPGGGMVASAGGMLTRLQATSFLTLGNTINVGLSAVNAALGGLDAGGRARALTAGLQDTREAIHRADASLDPLLRSLPGTADEVQQALRRANQTLASVDQSYGSGSDLPATLARKMATYYDTVRYTRLVADYLSRHPEAIARGTSGAGAER